MEYIGSRTLEAVGKVDQYSRSRTHTSRRRSRSTSKSIRRIRSSKSFSGQRRRRSRVERSSVEVGVIQNRSRYLK